MTVSAGNPGTELDAILHSTRGAVEERKRVRPASALEARAARRGAALGAERFRTALRRPGVAVIAEFKRRSPSAGSLREGAEVQEIAPIYERGGASAVSVLTEGPHFGGSLDDLRAARASCDLPLLRKDFIVDRYQLLEARDAGADAVLLIAAVLLDAELAALYDAARGLGLEVLVEVHDRSEVRRALAVGAELVGINNRDLRDFTVDVEQTLRLLPELPAGVTVVSESGIEDAGQLRRLEQAGVQAVLIGEMLMRSEAPDAALKALLGRSDYLMKSDAPL
jgi:indole-3-glycerol phosphate synthase